MISTTEQRLQADVGCSNHIVSSHYYSALQSVRNASIVGDYSPRSFRATGITNHLENGGTLEVIADGQTKRLYPQYGFQPTAPASIGMAQWLGR